DGGPRSEPQTWNPATWSRRRRVICVISGSGAILFLMSVIFTLVISSLFLRQEVIRTPTLFTTTTEPVFTGSFVSLPKNLSKWCQDLTKDPCAYHKKKFVTDCQKMTCSTVTIKAKFQGSIQLNRDIVLRHDGMVSARLEFRHIFDDEYGQVVTPPQGGLCLLPERKNENDETSFGRCRNQQCDPTPDSYIRQYLKFSPVDGKMVDAGALTKAECFAAGPDILTSCEIFCHLLNFILLRPICTCLFRRNGTEFNRRNVTEQNGNFGSIPFEEKPVHQTRKVQCSFNFNELTALENIKMFEKDQKHLNKAFMSILSEKAT
uniref:Uncharacterized protein n=1 Tax=Romanomermis culicivorax TaxID=13658 RepID=A0A915J7C3_ROMCU